MPRKRVLNQIPIPKGRITRIPGEYLDIWGWPVSIQGHTVISRGRYRGESDTHDPNKVWSLAGNHYWMDGKGDHCASLMVTADPAAELTYWKARLKLIEDANPEDKLVLIKEGLANIRNRIKELELTCSTKTK